MSLLRACPLARAAARSATAAVANPSRRPFSSSNSTRAPAVRRQSLRPSTPAEWNALRRQTRENRGEATVLAPLSKDVLSRPAFVEVANPAVFAHPSLASYEAKRSEATEENGRQKGRGAVTYERHEPLGKALLDFVVKDLLLEQYPRLRPSAIQAAADRILANDMLSHLAVEYGLVSRMKADPVAADTIAADPDVHAALFRSYAAALHLEHGLASARSWLRECFQSVIDHDYAGLRVEIPDAQKRQAYDTPLYRLDEFCKRRKIKPTWTITSKGGVGDKVFKADLEIGGAKASGSGRSIQLAKYNAATLALRLSGEVQPEPDPEIGYTAQLHAYAKARQLPAPQFNTLVVAHPMYECRLSFEGEEYVARGVGKVGARMKAARAAFEALGIDAKKLPSPVARREEESAAVNEEQAGRVSDSDAGGTRDVRPKSEEGGR